MRFNSYAFVFGFLPLALLGYQIAASWHRRAVVLWLSVVSLAFYAYWRPAYVILLVLSILFNYSFGALISRRIPNRISSQALLWFAIAINLATLCYYKYLFPLLQFVSIRTHAQLRWDNVLLPLGISFFTFTQIAYLVDLQQDEVPQQDLASYTLFVTFFPHLIAGPILHHAEIMPQFQVDRDYHLRLNDLTVGFSWFIMGLGKKALLADTFATSADSAFLHTAGIGTSYAWIGVFSYALQLYFDFSGYSDMALGLARMFSVDFPLNFSSPYKASSIIDFWQRWHMTLTRYINSYLYNPLSLWMSRRRAAQGKKISRKAMATPSGFLHMIAAPTTVALLIAGIWHGAGLQFIVFGLLHACYLTANHAWRIFREGRPLPFFSRNAVTRSLGRAGSVLLTFAAVLVAQIFFRASGLRSAMQMLVAITGLSHSRVTFSPPVDLSVPISLLVGLAIVWLLPNTQQILACYKPALELSPSDLHKSWLHLAWKPTFLWGLSLGLVFLVALTRMDAPTTFLYFQF